MDPVVVVDQVLELLTVVTKGFCEFGMSLFKESEVFFNGVLAPDAVIVEFLVVFVVLVGDVM